MATIDPKKHQVEFTVSGNKLAKVNSMIDGGPLKVHKDSWLAAVAADLLDPPTGTTVEVDYHDLEYAIGVAWLFEDDLLDATLCWVAEMDPITQLIADICDAGASWEKARDWHEIRLRVESVQGALPPIQRSLKLSEVIHVKPSAGGWFDELRPRMMALSGSCDMDLFAQTRDMLSGGLCDAMRAAADFQGRLKYLGLKSQGASPMSGLPDSQMARMVVAMLDRTRPPDKRFERHLPLDDAFQEVARRGHATEAEQFKPLFERAWRGERSYGSDQEC